MKNGGNYSRDDQDIYKRLVKLEEETLPGPFPLFGSDDIGAESLLEMLDPEQIESFFRITLQELNDFLCRQMVPKFTD
ncbi:hypothetical protein BMS3Abin13_01565 [bacterium BMS3Abin13]|nr:hypothetical protein BMS3Abin13_01565 [bacterium BMS3Abin13]